jgi:hypothetical protein
MVRLLKRIQGFVQQRSALEIFSCCTIMRPPTKLQVFANFLPPKKVTTLYHSPYFPDLSPPDYFLFSKLKIKLKGLHFTDVAEIQEAVTDELRRSQKGNFRLLFRTVRPRKRLCIYIYIYVNGAYFQFKKGYVPSSCVSDF